MRLSKKMIMATVLATSMVLTFAACGGGGAGAPSSSSERPVSSSSTVNSDSDKSEQPESKPGESSAADSGASKPESEMVLIDANNSKFVKFMTNLHSQNEVYERHIETKYNSLGEKVSEYTINAARKGENQYVRIWDGTEVVYSCYTEIVGNTRNTYTLYEDDSVALKDTIENTTSISSDSDGPNEIYATIKNIKGKAYYTEVYMDSVYDRHIVYFDKNGYPAYIVVECNNPYGYNHSGHQKTTITEFLMVQFNSNGLCRVPENCTVYTMESANLGRFLVDENGNKYYYSDKTLKVTDGEGNDVTEQFRWFTKRMNNPIPFKGTIGVWTG